MNEQEWNETKKKILDMPLSEMDSFLAGRLDGGHGLQEVLSQIESDAELSLRKVEYLEHRVWGGNHQGAVKAQNTLLRKIRKAMTKYITHDVNF